MLCPRLSRRTRSRIDRAVSGEPKRPVCVAGQSGIGKTTHLRAAFRASNQDPRWTTAREAVDEMVAALRADRYGCWREGLENDPRPLVMEHVEDLRGKPRTMEELRRCMERRLSHGGVTILTLTLEPGADDVLAWVSQCADVIWDRSPRHR
jgi:chromosomal replication initiation ATPase DnaA